MKNCVIASAARTAIGSYLGSLKTEPEQNLGAAAIAAAVGRADLRREDIDQVIMGCVAGTAANLARSSLLIAGLSTETPGYTVDRQCGSGLQAIIGAVCEISLGQGDVVVAGGAETMSRIPYYLPLSSRYDAYRMGDKAVLDGFNFKASNAQPQEQYPNLNMGITAENIASKYGISRERQDEFALDSQKKAIAAIDGGRFKDEIIPYEVKLRKSAYVFDVDEYPVRDTNMEKLGKLRAAFKREDGTVTAGNSSGMNDGASAVVVMSEEKSKETGIKPLVKIIDFSTAGVDPAIMGMGPVPAIQKILKRQGMKVQDIDLYEINEAFAAQSLGVLTELGMLPGTELYNRVNVNGGAIALGHPLGCSGARLTTSLIYELKRRNGKYGIVSLCIGGGQGIAMLFENC
ncbi:MAG: thiolase family protein [Clostridiales bacterium]|nr:thiolase family protein [Clostridiales bacterium]